MFSLIKTSPESPVIVQCTLIGMMNYFAHMIYTCNGSVIITLLVTGASTEEGIFAVEVLLQVSMEIVYQ